MAVAIGPEAWGVIGALVVVIGTALRFLLKWNRDNAKEACKRDERFLKFLENHMTTNTQAMTDAAASVRELANEVVGKCPGPKVGDE